MKAIWIAGRRSATFRHTRSGRIVDQADLAALADADSFVANDASEGTDDPREVTAARVSNYVGNRLAGAGLTYNTTTNQLDGGGAPQIELIDSLNDVTYTQADTADLSSRFGSGATAYVADIDADGTADAEINDLLVFQWRDNPSGVPSTRALGIRINDTGTTLPIRIVDPLTNSLANKTAADLTRYEFLFLSRQDGVFIQLAGLALADVMTRIMPDGGTAGQVLTKDTATDFESHGRPSRAARAALSSGCPTRSTPTRPRTWSRQTRPATRSSRSDAVEPQHHPARWAHTGRHGDLAGPDLPHA